MVSLRCIRAVTELFQKLGFKGVDVSLGQVTTPENLTDAQLEEIKLSLVQQGFQLLEDSRNVLVQQIKTTIIQIVYQLEEPLVENFSTYLSDKLGYNYTYMSNLFSAKLGITIERFLICHKIERIKELISYDELSITKIAYKMHYSSVAHLSSQFKKVTGLSPSAFKRLYDKRRNTLENICQ
jgi:AraC-like DNA-binding protein